MIWGLLSSAESNTLGALKSINI